MKWGKAGAGTLFVVAICHGSILAAATTPGKTTPAATGGETTAPPPPVHTRGVTILRNAPQGSAKEGVAPVAPVSDAALPTPAPTPAPAPAPAPVVTPTVEPAPAPQPVSEPEQPTMQTCDRPFARPQVTDSGTAAFTPALRKALGGAAASVVVDMRQPFSVNGPTPPELVPWLNQVKASGGIVSVKQYCQVSRGFFSFLRGLFKQPAQDPYAAANGYDVLMHVDGLVGDVTQIEFTRRAP